MGNVVEREQIPYNCWMGTWNNPKMTTSEFINWFDNLRKENIIQYFIFQEELNKQGLHHFQFFVEFKEKQDFYTLKKRYIPYGCHFRKMISTKSNCKNYCSKEETRIKGPFEIGEFIENKDRG